MNCGTPPPGPKDFLRFEDYQKALKVHAEFHKRVGNVRSLCDTTNNEDDFRKGMEALGFTYCEDEKCGNPWCEECGACMADILDAIEYIANSDLFGNLLNLYDKICPKTKTYNEFGCAAFPKRWFDGSSKEYRSIMAYEETYEDIMNRDFMMGGYYEELTYNLDLGELMREMYFILQTTLRGYNSEIIEKHKEKFLALLPRVFDREFSAYIAAKWNF